jgi:hypothetical protein
MGNFHTIVAIIGTFVIAISATTAFSVRKNSKTPYYLKYFYLYPLYVMSVSINTLALNFNAVYRASLGVKVEKSIVVIDFIFWGLFFINLFKLNYSKTTRRIVYLIFVCIFIAILGINYFSKSAYDALAYANVGKCLLCIVYFYSLFKSPPSLSLRHEPAFWIVTGLLFYSTLSIPVYLSINLFYANHYMNLISILFPLTNITIIIMHLLFIKGYLCRIQQPKTYSSL